MSPRLRRARQWNQNEHEHDWRTGHDLGKGRPLGPPSLQGAGHQQRGQPQRTLKEFEAWVWGRGGGVTWAPHGHAAAPSDREKTPSPAVVLVWAMGGTEKKTGPAPAAEKGGNTKDAQSQNTDGPLEGGWQLPPGSLIIRFRCGKKVAQPPTKPRQGAVG